MCLHPHMHHHSLSPLQSHAAHLHSLLNPHTDYTLLSLSHRYTHCYSFTLFDHRYSHKSPQSFTASPNFALGVTFHSGLTSAITLKGPCFSQIRPSNHTHTKTDTLQIERYDWIDVRQLTAARLLTYSISHNCSAMIPRESAFTVH